MFWGLKQRCLSSLFKRFRISFSLLAAHMASEGHLCVTQLLPCIGQGPWATDAQLRILLRTSMQCKHHWSTSQGSITWAQLFLKLLICWGNTIDIIHDWGELFCRHVEMLLLNIYLEWKSRFLKRTWSQSVDGSREEWYLLGPLNMVTVHFIICATAAGGSPLMLKFLHFTD